MITNEEEGSAVRQIDLHSNESFSMPRKMVQRDPLAEVYGAVVECFPIPMASVSAKMSREGA